MKKIIWIPLVILIIGVCIALAGFTNGGFKGIWVDRAGFHLGDYANGSAGNLVTVDENYDSFKSIVINADYFDHVVLKEGSGYSVRGQNYERYGGLDVNLDGDTIRVESRADRRWRINMGLDHVLQTSDTWLEITYPAGMGDRNVEINLSAGDISVTNLNAGFINIDNSFGNTSLTSVKSDKMVISAAAGKISMTDIALSGGAEALVITNDFGDVELKNITSGELTADLKSGRLKASEITAGAVNLSNDFGKIEINALEAKSLSADLSAGDLQADGVTVNGLTVKSDFGKVVFDRLVFTGICDINNKSGDVELNLLMSRDDVSYELKTDAGSVSVNGEKSSGSVSSRNAGSTVNLNARTDFGSVRVEFLK